MIDLGNAALKHLYSKMEALKQQMADPEASAALFNELDIDGDGRCSRKKSFGVLSPSPLLHVISLSPCHSLNPLSAPPLHPFSTPSFPC